MYTSAELALFAHVARRPEEQLDLGQAAFLLGVIAHPELDISKSLERLKELGTQAQQRFEGSSEKALALSRFLFEELGFRGNADDYHDPENSFLSAVLDRRVGIPISLSVLMIEVGRYAGVAVEGVGFPGHFLVRAPVEGGYLFFDPFSHGKLLPRQALRTLFRRVTGQDRDPDVEVLQRATKRHILLRMLQNLRAIYSQRNDKRALRFVLERAALLDPGDEVLARELATLTRSSTSPLN